MCVCMQLSVEARRRVSDPLELATRLSHQVWALEREVRSSGRAGRTQPLSHLSSPAKIRLKEFLLSSIGLADKLEGAASDSARKTGTHIFWEPPEYIETLFA